jgi:hypothetical protein
VAAAPARPVGIQRARACLGCWPCSPIHTIAHSLPLPRSALPSAAAPRCTSVDAYVACGGEADKSGHVKKSTLVKIIKQDFGLTIDIEELIAKIDIDQSGEIEFEEFKDLLS